MSDASSFRDRHLSRGESLLLTTGERVTVGLPLFGPMTHTADSIGAQLFDSIQFESRTYHVDSYYEDHMGHIVKIRGFALQAQQKWAYVGCEQFCRPSSTSKAHTNLRVEGEIVRKPVGWFRNFVHECTIVRGEAEWSRQMQAADEKRRATGISQSRSAPRIYFTLPRPLLPQATSDIFSAPAAVPISALVHPSPESPFLPSSPPPSPPSASRPWATSEDISLANMLSGAANLFGCPIAARNSLRTDLTLAPALRVACAGRTDEEMQQRLEHIVALRGEAANADRIECEKLRKQAQMHVAEVVRLESRLAAAESSAAAQSVELAQVTSAKTLLETRLELLQAGADAFRELAYDEMRASWARFDSLAHLAETTEAKLTKQIADGAAARSDAIPIGLHSAVSDIVPAANAAPIAAADITGTGGALKSLPEVDRMSSELATSKSTCAWQEESIKTMRRQLTASTAKAASLKVSCIEANRSREAAEKQLTALQKKMRRTIEHDELTTLEASGLRDQLASLQMELSSLRTAYSEATNKNNDADCETQMQEESPHPDDAWDTEPASSSLSSSSQRLIQVKREVLDAQETALVATHQKRRAEGALEEESKKRQRAEDALEKEKDSVTCTLCLSARSDVVLTPCRHLVCCFACTETMPKQNRKCPQCNQPIQQRIKVKL